MQLYRPLSPHIFIYKPQLSSLFSVFHRTTGIILTIGSLFFVLLGSTLGQHAACWPIYSLACFLGTHGAWFLAAAATLCLFSFFWHLSGGIRHLIWDFAPNTFLNKNNIARSAGYLCIFSIFCFSLVFFQFVAV